ncbi:MAG: hypothetical protein WA857_10820 [Candidatus Acidiferrum sp.]
MNPVEPRVALFLREPPESLFNNFREFLDYSRHFFVGLLLLGHHHVPGSLVSRRHFPFYAGYVFYGDLL